MKRYTIEIIVDCDLIDTVEDIWKEMDEVVSTYLKEYLGEMNVFMSYPQVVVEN